VRNWYSQHGGTLATSRREIGNSIAAHGRD
jgi:hypothetical protein